MGGVSDFEGALPSFVLDASMSLAWCFMDEQSSSAALVLGSLAKHRAIVPALWPFEIANSLWMGERRKRSIEENTVRWLDFLSHLAIVVDDQRTANLWRPLLGLAREHEISVYDAAYLELALRLSLPLATLDRRLQHAAKKAGIKLYKA